MKIKSLLFTLLIFVTIISCKKDKDSTPDKLGIVTENIQKSLDSLNTKLVNTATALAAAGADSATARAKLQQLYSEVHYAKEVAYITPQGVMQVIEPPAYYQYQGYSFSSDAAMMTIINNHQADFASWFYAIEGFGAVADIHSVYSGTNTLGAIELLFNPWPYLKSFITPMVSAPKEIFVLEKSGNIIFDIDLQDSAKNVFTDPYYNSFPDFVIACHKIVQEESGETSYTFYQTGTSTPVTKKAWWKTITLHNNAWKIVWSEEK